MASGTVIALVSKTSKVSFDDLKVLARAGQKASADFCRDWGLAPPQIAALKSLDPHHVKASDIVLTLVDTSTEDGALGWHSEEDGTVFGEIAAGDVLRSGGQIFMPGAAAWQLSVSTVLVHEILETLGNPDVNLWADRGDGIEDAREVCDAVQGDYFVITVPSGHRGQEVALPNYLLPAWFNADDKGPFDKMGLCKKPFEVRPGGYHVIRKAAIEQSEDGPRAVRKLEYVAGSSFVERGNKKRRIGILHGAVRKPAVPVPPPAVVEVVEEAPEATSAPDVDAAEES